MVDADGGRGSIVVDTKAGFFDDVWISLSKRCGGTEVVN